MTDYTEADIARELGNQFWYFEYRSDGIHWLERTKVQAEAREWAAQRKAAGLTAAGFRKPRTVLSDDQVAYIAAKRAQNVMWKDILRDIPETRLKTAMARYFRHCDENGVARPKRIATYKRWPEELRAEVDAMLVKGMGHKSIGNKVGKTKGQIEGYTYWLRRGKP